MPLIYRDFDMKFLKQMKRFPSRRHTLIPECNAIRSSLDLQSLRSYPDSIGPTSTLPSPCDIVNDLAFIDHLTEIRPYTAAAATSVVSDQQAPCYPGSPSEYSPNTGNRLNNNQVDDSSCEDGKLTASPSVVLETVVRTSTTAVSGRLCGVPRFEDTSVNTKSHKCTIL
ncbi:hypothetical protein KIN20_026692 [Parelaphostrongylus tenuis]|uniref:Uncharacterized protein n=1 Tax=Parelaphostrongylus tenuis TaxID=148309 RepID=A0AAD5QYB2_PARTN|nr:hypothetical protein KIN20_026692 [Parelaphostrongylus tenuis]